MSIKKGDKVTIVGRAGVFVAEEVNTGVVGAVKVGGKWLSKSEVKAYTPRRAAVWKARNPNVA